MATKKKTNNGKTPLRTSEMVAELLRLWTLDDSILMFRVSGSGNVATIAVMNAVEGQKPRLHVRHKNGMCLTQHGWMDEDPNDEEPSTLTQKKFINKFPDTLGAVWTVNGVVTDADVADDENEEAGQSAEVRQALQLGDELLNAIENDVPEHAMDKASDFFEDVQGKVKEVCETIRTTNRVTEAQQNALENWDAGVRRWIR